MWFIHELIRQKNIPMAVIRNVIDREDIDIEYVYGSDGKYLGMGLSDKDSEKIITEVNQ